MSSFEPALLESFLGSVSLLLVCVRVRDFLTKVCMSWAWGILWDLLDTDVSDRSGLNDPPSFFVADWFLPFVRHRSE